MRFKDVNIKSPCTEKLNASPAGCSGFYCGSCDKIVEDFREVSENNFNKRLAELGPERCGIFYTDQIYPERYQNSSTPRLLGFALTILTILGLSSSEIQAQSENKQGVENIVRDRQSHGIIPRDGLKVDNLAREDASEKHGTVTVAPEKDKKEESVVEAPVKEKPRRILGIFPRKRRTVLRGFF
ncbi:MAG: hypothetical protein JKX73_11320 [Flavobacteriales bacterium]|nr:hypothetical protein [Flavobacteriales bacterium]